MRRAHGVADVPPRGEMALMANSGSDTRDAHAPEESSRMGLDLLGLGRRMAAIKAARAAGPMARRRKGFMGSA